MHRHMTRGGLVAAIGILISITSIEPSTVAAQDASETADALNAEVLTAKGAWAPGVQYKRDDVVTARGSTWRAKKANKGKVPGQTQPPTAAFWEVLASGFNPKGAWVSTRKYQPNDLVAANGSTWRAKRTNVGKAPVPGADWQQFAAKGDTGAAGPSTGVPVGTQSVPAISFNGDPDTGIFSPEPGKIAMVGDGDLFLHNLGAFNTALGTSALTSNTTGASNTAVGTFTLANNTIGGNNTALGFAALQSNTMGSFNTALGDSALVLNTTGERNTALGFSALQSNTTGGNNIALGSSALQFNTTGSFNTAVGRSALISNTTGTQNTALGFSALSANTTGIDNTAVGGSALNLNTTGNDNTALGRSALFFNTTGDENTAVGRSALVSNTTGSTNTAVGASALESNTTGNSNTALGFRTLESNTTGGFNTALGVFTLNANASGANNTAVGRSALINSTTGSFNTAVGHSALGLNTDGAGNTAVGADAGSNATSPENSIFISNEGLAGDTATIKIGTQGTQTSTFIAGIHNATSASGIGVFVNASGQLGTTTSSRRYKDDIAAMGDVGPLLARLRPVTFRYRQAAEDGSKPLQYGLIAEEVEEVARDLVAYNKDGSVETVRYHFLPPLLLAVWQTQQKTIAAQQGEIAALKQRLAAIEARLPPVKEAAVRR